jgi:FkbM family methyltransferase
LPARKQKRCKLILDIVHIGGGDDYIGPAENLLEIEGIKVNLYLFDIREDSSELILSEVSTNRKNLNCYVIPIGIADQPGILPFNINKFPLSSSFLPPSKKSQNYLPLFPGCDTWVENTLLERQISVKVRTLDMLVKNQVIPSPDFLSMDIQGMEFKALIGAANCLSESVLGVISEVEFSEIYENQGLFQDQSKYLDEKNFRLVELYNKQYWYEGLASGEGFLTVAEALFLRKLEIDRSLDPSFINSPDRLLKLALISMKFGRTGYSFRCMDLLHKSNSSIYSEFLNSGKYKKLFNMIQFIEKNTQNYESNSQYFIENPPQIGRTFGPLIYRKWVRFLQILKVYAYKKRVRFWLTGLK